jgi:zinc protease
MDVPFLRSIALTLSVALAPVIAMSAPVESASAPSTVAPLHLPPITEEVLPNGLSVVTVEEHTLPLVAVRLVLMTGAVRDPKGREGVAMLTGQLLRRGTKSRTADQVDDTVESVGGMLGVDVGMESTMISATVPSEHTETALDVIADLARRPTFPKEEFDLARRRELAQLQQDLDNPSGMADRVLVRFFYGEGHPYSHPVEGRTASMKKLKRDDVLAFHKDTYSPSKAMLVFAGDVDPKTAKSLAEKFVGDWTGPEIKQSVVPMPAAAKGLEILLVDKADATQAQIRISVPGISRRDPSYYATQLANVPVGGAFTSRLVDEIRVNRGLSYSVGTRVVASRDVGAITFSSFTKTESVRELIDVALKVLGDFHEKGPSEDEIARAKKLEIGLYPGRVESVEQLGAALASMRVLGLPFDTVAKYRESMAAVTPSEAAQAAKRFPSAAGAKIVVLGKAAEIRPQLEGLGTVTLGKLKDYE